MAYDQSKLIMDVRICLGGVSEEKLPDNIIIHWGDHFDAMPEHEGDCPYIFWQTTLACLNYLIAKETTSENSSFKGTKEKVGDVQVEVSYEDSTKVIDNYKDLYDYYSNNPDKFGVIFKNKQAPIIINGVETDRVEDYRTNPNTTNPYNPLSPAAFPKVTGASNGRRGFYRGYYTHGRRR